MKEERNLLAKWTAILTLFMEFLVVASLAVGWFCGTKSSLVRPIRIMFAVGYLGMGVGFLILLFILAFRLFRQMSEAFNKNDITKKRALFSKQQKDRFPVFLVTLSMTLFVLLYFIGNLLMNAGS